MAKTAPARGLAHEAIDIIAKLYAVEKHVKDHELSYDEIKAYRLEKSKPILEEFYQWLLRYQSKVPPKMPIGKAFAYTLKIWPSLNTYLQDGRLEIDNNRSERAIKPFVIGRKNWLFMGNEKGATAATHLFSLIETAKRHGLNPFDYLRHVFTKLPLANSLQDYEALMPFNCLHLNENKEE